MAKIIVNSFLTEKLGAKAPRNGRLEIEAKNVRVLIAKLDAQFPGAAKHLESGVAVAIDGEIYTDPLLEPLDDESEVYFLPAIEAG